MDVERYWQHLQDQKFMREADPHAYADQLGMFGRIIRSTRFDGLMGLLILCNAITIGADTYYDINKRPRNLFLLDNFFTTVFVFEWFARIYTDGVSWLLNIDNLFDTFLVWGLVERFDIEHFSDFQPNEHTLQSSFSSVSTPNFARKYSLESS